MKREHRCGGLLRPAMVGWSSWWLDTLSWRLVPGFLCEKCGDTLFDTATVKSLEPPVWPTP